MHSYTTRSITENQDNETLKDLTKTGKIGRASCRERV